MEDDFKNKNINYMNYLKDKIETLESYHNMIIKTKSPKKEQLDFIQFIMNNINERKNHTIPSIDNWDCMIFNIFNDLCYYINTLCLYFENEFDFKIIKL